MLNMKIDCTKCTIPWDWDTPHHWGEDHFQQPPSPDSSKVYKLILLVNRFQWSPGQVHVKWHLCHPHQHSIAAGLILRFSEITGNDRNNLNHRGSHFETHFCRPRKAFSYESTGISLQLHWSPISISTENFPAHSHCRCALPRFTINTGTCTLAEHCSLFTQREH